MTAYYLPGKGTCISFRSGDAGFNLVLSEDWTIAAIERYLRELEEMYE